MVPGGDVAGCAPLASTAAAAAPGGAFADADTATGKSGILPAGVSCWRPPQAGDEQVRELDNVVGPQTQTTQSQSDNRETQAVAEQKVQHDTDSVCADLIEDEDMSDDELLKMSMSMSVVPTMIACGVRYVQEMLFQAITPTHNCLEELE